MNKNTHKIKDVRKLRQQQIYKEYIVHFIEIEDLKTWIHNYHKLITAVFNHDKFNAELYNELLDITFTIKTDNIIKKDKNILAIIRKKDTPKKKELKLPALNKIFKDFNCYFLKIQKENYEDFETVENDRLVLYNILESYFQKLTPFVNKKFLKASLDKVNNKIPKSKNSDLWLNLQSNIKWMGRFILIILILSLMSFPVLHYTLKLLPFNSTTAIPNYCFYLFISSVILSCFIIYHTEKTWRRFMPKRELTFARSIYEKQLYYTTIALMLSAVSTMIAVYTILSRF